LLDTQSFDDFTPSIVFEWRPSDDYMLYASYKQGFKAGGFDHSIQQPNPEAFVYDPETVVAYELGAKTVLMDGALTANLALFRSEFDDLQVTQLNIGATGFNTSNAAEARSQGLEVEVALQAGEFVTLRAILNWLDAEFVDYQGAQCRGNPAQTEAEGCITDPVTGTRSQDVSGQTLAYAPDFSGQFSADFRYPLKGAWFGSPVELVSNITIFSTSAYHTQVTFDPDQEQEAFTKIDALLGVASSNGKWTAELFGRNLTDELTISNANNTPIRSTTNNAVISRTRQVGLHVKYRF
jgi:iron complex outermembrane receptor protein